MRSFDEMHITEDLVYDKPSGELVAFINLGAINDHLIQFERQLEGSPDDHEPSCPAVLPNFGGGGGGVEGVDPPLSRA